MPVGEEDPKIVARNERNHPDVERSLRQFLNHDGPKGSRDEYRNAECWCFRCERHLRAEGSILCAKCVEFAEAKAYLGDGLLGQNWGPK